MTGKNVLVCVTGQMACERLIVEGVRRAAAADGTVTVLHVAVPGRKMMGYPDEAEALKYLLGQAVSHGCDMLVVKSDDVRGTILKKIDELKAGTLVAGRAPNYRGWDLLDDIQASVPGLEVVIA